MLALGNNLPDVPSPSELWKDERSKYRPWIIIFGIALLLIIAMYVSALVWNVIGESSIKQTAFDEVFAQRRQALPSETVGAATNAAQAIVNSWYSTYIVALPAVSIALTSVAALWYGASVYQSYRAKTFDRLALGVSIIIAITGFIAGYELLSLAWRDNPDARFPGGIYLIIARVLVAATALTVRGIVFRIRRAFLVSKQINDIKTSPEYQAMQKQFSNGTASPAGAPMMGPFGMIINPPAPGAPSGGAPIVAAPLAAAAIPSEVQELNALELEDLQKIAKRLSISGYETMSREQLIENILRITPLSSEASRQAKVEAREKELRAMTLAELRQVAKRLSLSGHEKMTKEELVKAILNVSSVSGLN